MPIIKWEPFGDLDRFFEDWPRMHWPRGGWPKMGWDLAVDVYEKDGNVVAEMNLPGIAPDKVDVEVEDNYVRISGKREEEKEEKEKNYYSKEIRRGSFERVIPLPEAVEKDKIKAEYSEGVLRVVMPKKPEEKKPEKKVKIEVKQKSKQ